MVEPAIIRAVQAAKQRLDYHYYEQYTNNKLKDIKIGKLRFHIMSMK